MSRPGGRILGLAAVTLLHGSGVIGWPDRTPLSGVMAAKSQISFSSWCATEATKVGRRSRHGECLRLLCSCGDHELARPIEPVWTLELGQRGLDLGPRFFTLGLGESGQHLVERSE